MSERERGEMQMEHAAPDDDAPTSEALQRPDDHEETVTNENARGARLSNEDESEDSDEGRENIFNGASSTWRDHTANERALISSLEAQRANDLSIHLYNTHALKSRAVSASENHQARAPQRQKRGGRTSDKEWKPDAAWTAWPLKSDDVPRREEGFGVPRHSFVDAETYRMAEPWYPSEDIEEELEAVILRRAKETFRERLVARPETVSTRAVKREALQGPHLSRSIATLQTTRGTKNEKGRSTPSMTGEVASIDFALDENETTELLKPVIRHTLVQLDDLLGALQRQREAQRSINAFRAGSPPTKSMSRRASCLRSTSRRLPEPKQSPSISEADNDDEGSESSAQEISEPKPKKRRPSKLLTPRDWREVLTMAQLVGWDQDVVASAARRCASLFGQELDLRSMQDQSTANWSIPAPESTIAEDARASSLGMNAARKRGLPPTAEVKKRWCPFQSCSHHQSPFEKKWRWREHLKRVHRFDQGEVERLEQQILREEGVSSGRGLSPIAASAGRSASGSPAQPATSESDEYYE